jgi:hypothetical protein
MVSLNVESAWSGLFFMSSEYVRVRRDDFVYPNARISARLSRFESGSAIELRVSRNQLAECSADRDDAVYSNGFSSPSMVGINSETVG